MAKRLRTVIVGLGRIGWEFHLPTAHAHAGFDVVAAVDPVQERLGEARERYGIDDGYADLESALAAVSPDLVVLGSPTHVHADQAVLAMQKGIDVFCDKPVARDLEETDRMVATMRETGRKLMVYQPKRAQSRAVALQSLLARGVIGPVYMIKLALSSFVWRHDWQAWSKFGGGMLNNYGAHGLDFMLHIAGEPIKRVAAHLRRVASFGDADDVVKTVLETESGVILDMDINMASAAELPSLIVFGTNGTITEDAEGTGLQARYFDPAELPEQRADESLAARDRQYMHTTAPKVTWQEEFAKYADHAPVTFYDKVHEYFAQDKPPFVPIEETRELMRVMDECRKYDAGEG